MNIQFSVVIWTVICFLVLMLVLKFLLFNPVLRLLDQRKEKLKKAEAKKAEVQKLTEEHEKRLEIIKEDEKIQKENIIKSELELIRAKNKQDIEEAKAQRFVRIEEYRKNTEKEKDEIIKTFGNSSEKIAKAFADRLISQ